MNIKNAPLETINYWFIRLRWIATAVALLLILVTIKGLHYLDHSTLKPLLIFVAILTLSNIFYTYLLKKEIHFNYIGEMQIIVDLIILTLMLIYSGGIENPLSFMYLFHVILSGIIFNKIKCYGAVAVSFIAYLTMSLGELYGLFPHYTLHIFPHEASSGLNIHTSHYPLYVWSMACMQLILMVLTAYFITTIMDRLRSEEKRSVQEHQRLQSVLEATGAGLIILNTDLWPLWYNKPILTWFGVDQQSWHESSKALIENIKTEILEVMNIQSIEVIEREKITKGGKKQNFQITIAPLINEDGNTFQVVALVQDITEMKILEVEMVHSAKMVSLGTMASGVAHEVGNPLASISTRLHLLETDHTKKYLKESIGLLQNEIKRIERIVHGISQFGRPSKENWKPNQVNQIIKESLEIIKYHKSAKPFKIELDLDKNLSETVLVRDQIKQALLNLMLNAVESVTSLKLIQIKSFSSQGFVKISIKDYGTGISKEGKEKIFEPFFTTKSKGSGLGLFIVNQIIQAHGGYIDVDSKLEQGVMITVALPIHMTKKYRKKAVKFIS